VSLRLWAATLEFDAALHAEHWYSDTGVAVRVARRHFDYRRRVQVDLVRIQAHGAELKLIENTASTEREDNNDRDDAAHNLLPLDRSFSETPDYRVRVVQIDLDRD
jgi:hypothetical protein